MNATLYDYLFQKADLQSAILPFAHNNLSLLPFGENAKNSIALLSSEGMRELFVVLRERYDLIVVDGPPILSLPDMHIIERLVDGIILVVRAGKTPREAALTAIKSLGENKITGIVLNESEETIESYYRYSYQDV
jgi:protein-tyrosine kinase